MFESKNFIGHDLIKKLKDYRSLTETSSFIINNSELLDYFRSEIKDWNSFKSFFDLEPLIDSIDFSKIGMMDFEFYKTFNIPQTSISKMLISIKNKFRSVENEFRLNKGYKIVGSYTHESILYQRVSEYFKSYRVVSQGSPFWLKPQRFDIYFPDFNIAVEYQGQQHYEAVDFFGSEDGYLLNQQRDLLKQKKCKKNGCFLIEVLPYYDFDELVRKIEDQIRKIS